MKIILADDHSLFREVLVEYIKKAEPGASVHLCLNATDVITALYHDDTYDLIMMDFKMPGMENLSNLQAIINRYPDIPVALISGVVSSKEIHEAIGVGISGYIPKTLSGNELMFGIKDLLKGNIFFPKENADFKPSYYSDAADILQSEEGIKENIFQLSPREQDVLKILLNGASNKEIANKLNLQIVTVKMHVRAICKKMKAKNRTHAALIAYKVGHR